MAFYNQRRRLAFSKDFMKATGNDKATRAAMLADQLADDGAEPVDIAPTPVPVSYAPETPAPPAPVVAAPVAPDMAALVQMLAGAIAQSGTMNAEAFKDAMGSQSAMARNPIAETYLSGGYPGKSVFSHPDGDDKHPRTELRCPMFLGIYDQKGETTPAFEIDGRACKETERVLLNQLVPGAYMVERNDGKSAKWLVVQQTDDLGEAIRLVIAIPPTWLSKAEQAQMPSQTQFLKQLSGTAA
jgi:hypothetical protein